MALQKHLGDAGGGAEVAVDLERRMGVEEIRIEPALAGNRADGHQEISQNLVGVVAVEEAGPEVNLPAHAPAGGRVAAIDERLPSGIE